MADVWEVLADASRRAILQRLAGGDLTAGEIAAAFDISRPGVSRHLRVLREAGLVEVRVEAQHRVYRLRPAALTPVDRWHEQITTFWSQRLDALDTEVARGRSRSADPSTTTGETHDRAAG